MGFKAIAAAREAAEAHDLSATEARMLELLAEYAHDDEEALEAWPSYRTLGKYARITGPSAKRVCRRLEERGLLTRANRYRDTGAQTSNLYILNLQAPVKVVNSPPDKERYPPRVSIDNPPPGIRKRPP